MRTEFLTHDQDINVPFLNFSFHILLFQIMGIELFQVSRFPKFPVSHFLNSGSRLLTPDSGSYSGFQFLFRILVSIPDSGSGFRFLFQIPVPRFSRRPQIVPKKYFKSSAVFLMKTTVCLVLMILDFIAYLITANQHVDFKVKWLSIYLFEMI